MAMRSKARRLLSEKPPRGALSRNKCKAMKLTEPRSRKICWVPGWRSAVQEDVVITQLGDLAMDLPPPSYYFTNYFHAWAYYLKLHGGKR